VSAAAPALGTMLTVQTRLTLLQVTEARLHNVARNSLTRWRAVFVLHTMKNEMSYTAAHLSLLVIIGACLSTGVRYTTECENYSRREYAAHMHRQA
jgi:hypothetical protein